MSYGGHLSYRLVYNNLSNAVHNTMRPLKSKGVHCIKIRVISQGMLNPFRMGSAFYFENNAANVPVIYYNPDKRGIFFANPKSPICRRL